MSALTDQLWERFGRLTIDQIPADVVAVAHQCVFDWPGCALAGSAQPGMRDCAVHRARCHS